MNYTERKQIQEGKTGPDIPLSKLMVLVAVDFAINFRENVKTIPDPVVDDSDPENPIVTQSYSDASQYKGQVMRMCNQILNAEHGGLLNSFTRVFVTILGRTNYTYAQIEAANQSQWEGFLNNKILEIVEHLAGVSKEGKTEYDDLA